MKVVHNELFPTTVSVYTPDYNVTEEEIEFLKSIPVEKDYKGNVYLSFKTKTVLENIKLKNIKDVMFETATRYAEDVLGISNELAPLHSWVTKQEKGGQHEMHNHTNTLFNLVYYIEGSKNNTVWFKLGNGRTRLEEGFNFHYNRKTYTPMNSNSAILHPEDGQIICMPGWLFHGTDISIGPKLGIAQNFFIKGNVDGDKLDTKFKFQDIEIDTKINESNT